MTSTPASASGRIWWIVGAALALLVAGAWLRARRPAQSPATQPAAAASPSSVSEPESGTIPARSPSVLVPSWPVLSASWRNSTNATLIGQLLNSALRLKERRQAVRELARIGSDDAIAALGLALQAGPPYLKAAIGESLATSPHPEAWTLLLYLADGTDEIAARGALRGLALRNDAKATDVLAQFLGDTDKPQSLRTEAALALGDVERAEALAALTRAVTDEPDEDILESVLQGLGKRPFAETEAFFRNYLEDPHVANESKIAALEALGQAQGEVAPFLLQYATDPDPDVRAAAAWALISADTGTALGSSLVELVRKETEPEVRVRLYQALSSQAGYDGATALALAQRETDSVARLAALEMLARVCDGEAGPDLLEYFKQTAIPELKNTALTGERSQDRLAAVIALDVANTAESHEALQRLASGSADRRVTEAAQVALHTKP